jgi:hypothetical protein
LTRRGGEHWYARRAVQVHSHRHEHALGRTRTAGTAREHEAEGRDDQEMSFAHQIAFTLARVNTSTFKSISVRRFDHESK